MQSGKYGPRYPFWEHSSTLTPKDQTQRGPTGGRDSVVSNRENKFCCIYLQILMDNDNVTVNYTVIVHNFYWNRRGKILVRFLTQTISVSIQNIPEIRRRGRRWNEKKNDSKGLFQVGWGQEDTEII